MGRHLLWNRPSSVAALKQQTFFCTLLFHFLCLPVALEFGVDEIHISVMVEFYGHCLIKIAVLDQSEHQALPPTQEDICCSGVGNINQKNRYSSHQSEDQRPSDAPKSKIY